MKAKLQNLLTTVFLLLLSWPLVAAEYSHPTINRLLASEDPPDGVVFELVHWDDDTWSWAAPMIADLRSQLQGKYPDIDVAVVSHGKEQFQLTHDRIGEQPEALSQLQTLTNEGVNLHVCGTHSQWNEVPESDYIDIVDVSPSGPAQVNDYLKLGYRLVVLRRP